MFSFLLRLAEVTGDPAFAQVAYLANGETTDGLTVRPVCCRPRGNPGAFTAPSSSSMVRHRDRDRSTSSSGTWRSCGLAKGDSARAAWLDYDAGGGHAHFDAMNLGLVAKGLDLMPDLGYPPVQYGGWGGAKFSWYVITPRTTRWSSTASSQAAGAGTTTLWGEGPGRRSDPRLGRRTGQVRSSTSGPIALVDISATDSYVIDLFRVVGGTDHAKFMHSHFGRLLTPGLTVKPAAGLRPRGADAQLPAAMRGRQHHSGPTRLVGGLPGRGSPASYSRRNGRCHLRYTDLTAGAEAYAAESWVSTGGYSGNEEAWIPRLMIRRRAERARWLRLS